MKQQVNAYWSKFLMLAILAAMTVIISGFVHVSAENSNSVDDFKVGDKVEVSTGGMEGDQYYQPCVITEVRNNGYMVQCVYGNTIYFVQKGWVRPAKKAETVKEPERAKEPDPVKPPQEIKEPEQGPNDLNEQLFEALDLNHSGWLSGRELLACQCIQFDKNGNNEVTKAEFLAGIGEKEGDDDEKETPAENEPVNHEDCTSNAVLVTKNSTAKPSEELFKGVIFYNYNLNANGTGQAPLKVGVTFLSFQMGASFTNIARNGDRINDAAPVNTTIYRVKSKHIVCEQYRDSTRRRQVEGNYACFKNKDGIWVCGIDGFPKITQLN